MFDILYVEDEPAIAKGVVKGLEAEGFRVAWADSAEQAGDLLESREFHLVLLDVRLPGVDGFTFCREVRARGITLPIIMLTARDEEIDRILGLEIGADDYLVKPFSLRELVSRIRAQIRRAHGEFARATDGDVTMIGNLKIDRRSLRVFRDGEELPLTPMEMRLLLCLADNRGAVMTRSLLIEKVWGHGYLPDDDRTVDVHIRHLREKVETDPSHPEVIETVRGYGYRFVAKSS